jgi:peptidyl-tRNA hydrolase
VLAPPSKADRQAITDRFPELVDAVRLWMDEGVEAAMNRYNG